MQINVRSWRRPLGAFVATLLVAAAAVVPTGASAAPSEAVMATASTQASYAPQDDFTATWKRADALKVRSNTTNTSPLIPANFPVMTDKVWIWDTWPLTNLSTNVVTYKGWHVIFSLTAPRNIFFGDRHWQARIGFFYSRDGKSWKYGGHMFPADTSLGSREWAGSTILRDGNEVQTFYTASGRDNGGIDPNDALQRLATATGRIHADDRGVWFTGFRNHKIIAEADGRFYQTLEQSQAGPIIYAFRDPFAFRNPDDDRTYILFEGNTGGVAGEYQCQQRDLGKLPPGHTVPAEARYYTGNIGLMEATRSDLRSWRLLPPILSANCVNQQTERPHLVFRNGKVYLFTISHTFTFAPGLTGPDGVYGFVGESLRSNYRPLNASALVLGNPPEQRLQQYSHYVMPNLLVESFIDTIFTQPGEQAPVYGGTLAPTLRLDIRGNRTYVVEELDYGYIPATQQTRRQQVG
ncbi:glycoside hydrolase family 68 protein [Micromonospora sp. KC721]|uniref:glycoside hydrolase family 68 protein n=1 Tax=Micromonospora sp. KC721 TaxID=2530380 RepID=UPI001A9F0091|nr:glycoside hydrolase family 68 protein [Micromonospora sp. KC721]